MKDYGKLETEISQTGKQGQESKTRGNRDEWRGVRDRVEIGWRWVGEGEQRYNGKGVEQNGVVRDPSAIWYLTHGIGSPHSFSLGQWQLCVECLPEKCPQLVALLQRVMQNVGSDDNYSIVMSHVRTWLLGGCDHGMQCGG